MTLARAGALLANAALAAMAAVVVPDPRPAAAQQPRVSAFVPQGHWSIDAARRLHGLGLMPPGYDPAMETQYLHELAAAFRAAAEAGGEGAAAYHDRLVEEWGRLAGAGDSLAAVAWVSAGGRAADGRLRSGRGSPGTGDWVGPLPVEDLASPYVGVAGYGRVARLAWAGRWDADEDGGATPEAYAVVGLGPVGVWGGLRIGGLAAGPASGLVLTRLDARPGGGLQMMEPVTLPWLFRHLGPARLSMAWYRGTRNADFENPWIWETRGTIEPHPRLRLAVNRGIMFGGQGNSDGSLRDIAYMLIGKHTARFDNQIVSVSARYRVPLSLLPLVTYLEWGFEDSAGAIRDVPGIIAGLETPAVPWAPWLSLGVARTSMAPSCCGNPIWYRNYAFRGGWADDGVPLGHPLGGQGVEWLGYGRADVLDARLQLDGRVFARERGEENLFAPDREGGSVGGGLRATYLGNGRWQAFLAAALEDGWNTDWRETELELGVRVRP